MNGRCVKVFWGEKFLFHACIKAISLLLMGMSVEAVLFFNSVYANPVSSLYDDILTKRGIEVLLGSLEEEVHPHLKYLNEGRHRLLQPGKFYAVLVNGGFNLYDNHFRFWNNLSWMYTTLRSLQVPASQIFVFNADGADAEVDMVYKRVTRSHQIVVGPSVTGVMSSKRYRSGPVYLEEASLQVSSPIDLDLDGQSDVRGAAVQEEMKPVFSQFSNLSGEDTLFVFVTDHGQRCGEHSQICLWKGEHLLDQELALWLKSIPAQKVIWLQTCYGGGFIDDLLDERTLVISAAAADKTSLACDSECQGIGSYDEFAYHGISALRGFTPEGMEAQADFNEDQQLSWKEVFDYAIQANSLRNDQDQLLENPQLAEGKKGLVDIAMVQK